MGDFENEMLERLDYIDRVRQCDICKHSADPNPAARSKCVRFSDLVVFPVYNSGVCRFWEKAPLR